MSKTKRITTLLLTVIMLLGCFNFAIPVSAADTATISFDVNGGVNPPADITVNCGTLIYLTDHQPSKPGMVFRGWAFNKADADKGNITYPVGVQNPILVNSSATLYASWAYEVTLHPGHQGWGNTQKLYKFPAVDLELFHHKSDIQANYGMNPGVAGDIANLMVFVEWNTNELPIGRGNGTSYHERYTANAPTTLYCIWGNPVIYDANGGTFPVSKNDIQEEFVVNYSNEKHDTTSFANFYIPNGENAPYKAGARQLTDEDGNELYGRVFADSGNIVRFESRNTWLEIPIFNDYTYQWADFECATTSYGESGMKFTAVWEPAVIYKANGGVGNDITEYMTWEGPTLYDFADYTVRNNAFVKDSGRFLGWNTKPDGTGTSYAAGDVITDYASSDALVLYAQWSAPVDSAKEYTIAFNAMEGYLEEAQQSFTIAYGDKIADIIAEMPVPTRPGYTFRGWFNDVTGAELVFDEEYYSYTTNVSYSPKWELHSDHVLQAFKKVSNCTETGYFTQVCEACEWYSNIEYEKTGHNYSAWKQTGNGTEVVRACTSCGLSETEASTAMVQQQVIAYINKDVMYTDGDIRYIDVLNYLGPAIDKGPGNYPFDKPYFAQASNMWQRAKAQNPNIKIVLTIFNRNIKDFENWIATPANRAEFANHMVGAITAHNFDGLDIDFEFPSDLTLKDDFALFLGEVKARLNVLEAQRGKEYILSIATPAASWACEKYDLVACSQYLDYFNIMNYDLYCGTAVPYTHHHTPPYDNQDPYGHVPTGGSVQGDILLYKSLGIPADKIVSGMGLYSREWFGAANINHGLFQAADLQASNLHYDLLVAAYINKNGYTRYWDDVSKAPYLYNPSGGGFLSYEDPESLSYKFEIIAREGVRGCMVFDYVTCDGAGIFPYIRANIGQVTHACHVGRYETTQLSCTTAGHAIAYCGTCGKVMNDQMVYNEGHYATDWEMHTEPTATKAGKLSAACLFCGEEIYRELEPLGYKVSFDAGEGSKIGSTSFIIQKGQTYAEVVGEDPQATLEGTSLVGWYYGDYMLDTSDTFNFDSDVTFVAVWEDEGEHTHVYTSKVTKAATCTAEGIMTYTCRCGDSYTEKIAKLAHDYVGTQTVAPTCKAEGEMTYSCVNCGNTYTESIAKRDHAFNDGTTTTTPTCTEAGVKTYTCMACGETKTEAIAALGHVWKDWETVKEATETEAGLKQRSCRRGCGAVEEEVIPALGGETSGLAVSSDGPNLTISGMADVKDVFIALGSYATYADVKANAAVRLTPTKLNGASEYTYTLKEGGYYTVLVRYNDGTQTFLYQQINVTEPGYAADGLQLTVSNLDNVKVIRTAYGSYTTVSQIKKAEGARAFTAKNDIKGADNYMIQYRKSGTVTVAVQYNDGYTDIYTYEVEQKVPTFVQSNNVVTISDIDDLYVIRYAPGEWTTSSQIKAATGSKALKADAAVDGVITVKDLKAGTYTFCVQYNDESYNYYVITVE
ncbi:MAG: InlB B-repeat-containing protein [Clostridia bacterium]|nr:InlB B-repeat-containing protein [Clostridia bacterium]